MIDLADIPTILNTLVIIGLSFAALRRALHVDALQERVDGLELVTAEARREWLAQRTSRGDAGQVTFDLAGIPDNKRRAALSLFLEGDE